MMRMKGLCSIAVADEAGAAEAASNESFAAVVVDLNLRGGRSGLDVLQRLRAEGRSRTAPMFILTGQRDLSSEDAAIVRDHHVQISFKGESLLRFVDRIKAEVERI